MTIQGTLQQRSLTDFRGKSSCRCSSTRSIWLLMSPSSMSMATWALPMAGEDPFAVDGDEVDDGVVGSCLHATNVDQHDVFRLIRSPSLADDAHAMPSRPASRKTSGSQRGAGAILRPTDESCGRGGALLFPSTAK